MTATVSACPECGRRCMSCLTKIAAAGSGVTPPARPAAAPSSSGSDGLPPVHPGDDWSVMT